MIRGLLRCLFMTETSEIMIEFADRTLSAESIRGAAKTVEDTHLIVVPGEWSEAVIRKSSDMTTFAGQRIPRCPHRTVPTLECDADRQFTIPNLSWVDYLLIIGLSVVCALVFNTYYPKGLPIVPQNILDETVSFENLAIALDKHKKGETLFVDAMPHSFYEQNHVAGAVSLPVAIFDFMYDMSIGQTDKSKEIIVYGRTISKRYDVEVASNLVARGHKNVKILEGGLDAWREKHYPVEP